MTTYEIRHKLSGHPREAAEGKMYFYVFTASTHDSKGAFPSREQAQAFIAMLNQEMSEKDYYARYPYVPQIRPRSVVIGKKGRRP